MDGRREMARVHRKKLSKHRVRGCGGLTHDSRTLGEKVSLSATEEDVGHSGATHSLYWAQSSSETRLIRYVLIGLNWAETQMFAT